MRSLYRHKQSGDIFAISFFKLLTAKGDKTKLATAIGALADFTHVPVPHFIRRVSETLQPKLDIDERMY